MAVQQLELFILSHVGRPFWENLNKKNSHKQLTILRSENEKKYPDTKRRILLSFKYI